MTTPKSKPSTTRKQREQAATPELGSHSQMHQDHRQWLSDIASWRDDLVLWQADVRRVLVELKELKLMLEEHDRAMVKHSETIFTHRQTLTKHEHVLAQLQQGGAGDDLIGCSCAPHEESERHAQQMACHEAAKQRHRAIVSQWEHLHKAMMIMPKV